MEIKLLLEKQLITIGQKKLKNLEKNMDGIILVEYLGIFLTANIFLNPKWKYFHTQDSIMIMINQHKKKDLVLKEYLMNGYIMYLKMLLNHHYVIMNQRHL